MKLRNWVSTLIIICLLVGTNIAFGAATPSTGLFIRSNCSTISNPVANATWCLKTTDGQLYGYNGSAYTQISGGGGGSGCSTSGTELLKGNGSGGCTNASAAANSKLLGAGATGSGAPYSELTLGANLSMSGNTLNATGGGGITRTLIETFTVGSDQTSITFAATLDGDTDQVYEIEGNLVNNSGADIDLTLQPNAVNTNQTSNVRGTDRAYLLMVNSSLGNTNKTAYVFCALVAKTAVGPRRFITNSISEGSPQNALLTWFGAGFWTDTSTNITSMRILSSSANGIGSGSEFRLYKRSLNPMFWF